MTNETAQQEAQPDEMQKPDNEDPLRAFGSVFRQQLDQAIEPIVENIRRQQSFVSGSSGEQVPSPQADSPRADQAESAEQVSPTQQSTPSVISFAVDRPQLEGALHAALEAVLEALFSDDLQRVYRERSRHTVRSLVAAGRGLSSDGQAFAVKPKQFAEPLDKLVEELFSDSIRENARRNGEQAIHDLIGWDAPAARQAGAQLFSELTEQRFAAFAAFWEHVVVTLLEAGSTAAQPADSKASDDAETSKPEPAPENDLPQTLVRSDKRAQDIWIKAHDRAADKDGPGARAERAAYAALKERYEKKGDHWVKKSGD